MEAEITGKLEHPGVVPVYGLGSYDDGRPFYAMRFVKGDSLKEAIRRFHEQEGSRDAGQRSVEMRGLLDRFLDVCDAVAYAHSRGVLHRDLKPGNVMLGRYGETLVVDWGLAKLLGQRDEARLSEDIPLTTNLSGDATPTELGKAIGTPEYMSPEQAAGRLDLLGPRSDVYSLGATLYCLLTGRAPFARDEKEGQGGLLRKVEHGDFLPPRRVKPNVPRPLEAICCKSMARLAEDRYESVVALARDIRQWLADEPVTAYREPLVDRARRWGRRHRTLVSVGVALLLAGVVALGAGLWFVNEEKERTAEQRDRAVEAEEREAERRAEAETNLARAEKAEKEAKGNLKLAKEALDECYNAATNDPIFQGQRMEKARNLLLRKTLRFYKNFRVQRPNDRALQAEEAKQWSRVGYIEQILLRPRQAQESSARACELYQALAKAHPNEPEYQQDLAITHINRGKLLGDLDKHQEALKEYEEARDIQQKLVKAHPNVPDYQHDLARTHNNIGSLLAGLDKRQEALREYEQARDIQQMLVKAYPHRPEYQYIVAITQNNLGSVLAGLGKAKEALKEHEQARDIQQKLVKAHPNVPDYQDGLASTHHGLGYLLDDLGWREEALKEYEQARDQWQKLVVTHPDLPEYQNRLAIAHTSLGNLLNDLGRREVTLKQFEKARDLRQKLVKTYPEVPHFHNDLASTHNDLASLLTNLDKRQEALKEYEQARDLQEKLVKAHPEMPQAQNLLANTHNNLGNVLAALGKREEPLTQFQKARELQEKLVKFHPEVPQYQNGLATTHNNLATLLARVETPPRKESSWFSRLGTALTSGSRHPHLRESVEDAPEDRIPNATEQDHAQVEDGLRS